MSTDLNWEEQFKARVKQKNTKKKTTKMIRDPHAGGRRKITPEQKSLIKKQKDADDKKRSLKREALVWERRRAAVEKEKEIQERQAHRKAQQDKRERLAMKEFGNPDNDEYDPYTDDEYLKSLYDRGDKLKLRF